MNAADGLQIAEMLRTAALGVELHIPQGDYVFHETNTVPRAFPLSNTVAAPSRSVNLLLEGKRDLTLDFQGSRLWFEGWTLPLAIYGCSNLTVKNCTLDWSVPPVAEATVLQADASTALIRLDPTKYPHYVRDGKLHFPVGSTDAVCWGLFEFDGITKEARGASADRLGNPEWQEGSEKGTLWLKGSFPVPPLPGNLLVLRFGERTQTGIFCSDCTSVHFENVTIHTACGVGVVCQFCRDVAFDGLRIVPSPSRRVMSVHDDGLQCVSCSGKLLLRACEYRGMMDDCVNIHGTETVIDRISDQQIFGRFAQDCSAGFAAWAKAGDFISFAKRDTLNVIGTARVESFCLLDRLHFAVSFSEQLSAALSEGDAMENLTNTPSVEIQDCDFGSGRARGLLVTTPQPVRITKNRFNTSGAAILCSGDANYWFESGACKDVLIQNNDFSGHCLSGAYEFCGGVVSLTPVIQKPEESRGYHRSIKLIDNTFHYSGKPLLSALCVDGLTVRENRIVCDGNPDASALWKTEYCRNVRIEGSVITAAENK